MTMLGTYNVGDQPSFTATFRNAAGALADPTVVKFITYPAGGTPTIYVYGTDPEVVRDSAGVFTFTHPQLGATLAGKTVHIRANGSGAVTSSDEDTFRVKPTAFTTPLP
ncbi:MAG: hypothetical protein HY828_18360 [Actinobacteria bacterium]|nr:hypothetical protein [Actinomycetota bacterium]